MQSLTPAIVLSAIKYKETSLIVRCFTAAYGFKTYMVHGVLRKKKKADIKPAYFLPLSRIVLQANHTKQKEVYPLDGVSQVYFSSSMHTDMVKNAIVFFLAEVLCQVLVQEPKNDTLYTYIDTALSVLDTQEDVVDFPIIFLMQLTKYLGFYPDTTNQEECSYFSIAEAVFTNKKPEDHYIEESVLSMFVYFLNSDFQTQRTIFVGTQMRQEILKTLILYFTLHLQGFKSPKSISILQQVFY